MKVDQYTGPLVFVSSDKQLAKAAARALEVSIPKQETETAQAHNFGPP